MQTCQNCYFQSPIGSYCPLCGTPLPKESYESVIKEKLDPLTKFRARLLKIGIELELVSNFPWIYLDKINGQRVTEKFQAEHGFCIGFHPWKEGVEFKFTDQKEIFKLIRKYVSL